MTQFVSAAGGSLDKRLRRLFKARDIFLHDGNSLRRFTIGAKLQVAALGAALTLLAWSAFATIQITTAADEAGRDVEQMERQVTQMQASLNEIRREAEAHAAVLEQRQAFLAAMLTGEEPAQLARLLPQQAPAADDAAGRAISAPYAEVADMQLMLVERAREAARQRYQETAQRIRRLGINPDRLQQGSGGPFEAVQPLASADPRFRQLFQSWRQLDQLENGDIAIPAGRPVQSANFTSGFGVRSAPFRGRAAMHGGVDLAGPTGTPIYATADGIVGRAGYEGAYGNLVEINHGQGIQTRYGHMSRLVARPGQRVRRGELIGLMGSTGRSTGSHLHYEVRIDGRAVNPIPFMQGNDYLAAVQRRAAAGAPIGLGGPGGAAQR